MITVFKNISECLTLEGAFKKEGRKIQEEDLSIIQNASIVVNNGRIEWIGESKKLPKQYRGKKEISLKGLSVLPGFVECHTHSIFSGNRSQEFEMKFQGKTYAEIAQAGGGILSTVRATRKASEKELMGSFLGSVSNFLKQGVTTLEVKSGYGLDLKNELKILKVARKCKSLRVITTYLGPHAKAPESTHIDQYFESILEDLDAVKKSKLADRVDIFIEKNYFSSEQAKRYFKKAQSLGFKVVSHTNQLNPSDGVFVSTDCGAVSCDHLNYLEEKDIQRLSVSHVTCVFIPTADFYLKIPYPPARKLIDSGARVALSTDFNPGSSPTQDLNFVGLVARREMKMNLAEVISAWTVGASYALSLEKEVGSLTVGKSADFVVLSGGWRDLFYRVGISQIQQVYYKGRKTLK